MRGSTAPSGRSTRARGVLRLLSLAPPRSLPTRLRATVSRCEETRLSSRVCVHELSRRPPRQCRLPHRRLQQDVKLDFKDVLIRPARSTLKSRSQARHSRDINPLMPQRAGGPPARIQLQVWQDKAQVYADHRCQHGSVAMGEPGEGWLLRTLQGPSKWLASSRSTA